MNREIKFRAWDKENNKMLYSPYRAIVTERINAMFWDEWDWMQFTGLLDKNGKKIYEGDVVRIWADPKHYGGYTGHDYAEAVVWNPQEARFELTEHGFYDFEFIQVIGNIYENKELLG